MKTIFLVRHGESEANVGTHFSPASAPLTEKGREQAEFIAERVSRLPVDVMLSSTMGRAKETAQAISEKIGMPIEFSDELVEVRYPSAMVGLEKVSAAGEDMWRNWTKAYMEGGPKVDDGEDFTEARRRALKTISTLEQMREENVLLVTHGRFMRFLCFGAIFGDSLTPEIFTPLNFGLRINNTGLTIMHYDPTDSRKDWWVSVWNDHAHLG